MGMYKRKWNVTTTMTSGSVIKKVYTVQHLRAAIKEARSNGDTSTRFLPFENWVINCAVKDATEAEPNSIILDIKIKATEALGKPQSEHVAGP